MKIYLTDQHTGELITFIEYPEDYVLSHPDGVKEFLIQLNPDNPLAFEKKIFVDGVIANFIQPDFNHKFAHFVNVDQPYMQLHFELNGHTLYTPKAKHDMQCNIPQGSHCLMYFPALNGILNKTTNANVFRVEIEISLAYLNRIFNGDLSILGKFSNEIKNERPAMLGGRSYPITRQMRQILMEIYHCNFVSQFKKLYIEIKLQELLLLQINQISTDLALTSPPFNNADKERIAYTRELIDKNLQQPFSIEELAGLTGINRTKMQKDFKELFGSTIYGYIAEERMKQAKHLLLNEEYIKVSEVARKVGYKNANHFSTAFKKKFGYLPKSIKGQ